MCPDWWCSVVLSDAHKWVRFVLKGCSFAGIFLTRLLRTMWRPCYYVAVIWCWTCANARCVFLCARFATGREMFFHNFVCNAQLSWYGFTISLRWVCISRILDPGGDFLMLYTPAFSFYAQGYECMHVQVVPNTCCVRHRLLVFAFNRKIHARWFTCFCRNGADHVRTQNPTLFRVRWNIFLCIVK